MALAFLMIVLQVLLAVVNILAGEDKREKGEHYGFNYLAAGACLGAALAIILQIIKES
jgi:hypothetical protein